MTRAADAPALAVADLEEAVRALRERGLRLSSARRLVLEALFDDPAPVAAEELAARLRLEITSVYRNLETLERHGLVRHVHLGHGPGRYAVAAREYLFCERCGAIRALAPAELEPLREEIRRRFGLEARFSHFPIVGRCLPCAAEGMGTPSGAPGVERTPGPSSPRPAERTKIHAWAPDRGVGSAP